MSGSDTLISYIENHEYRSGLTSLHVIDEFVQSTYFCLYLKNFSPFNELLNEIIMNFNDAGIFDYDVKDFLNPKGIHRKIEEDGPQVLTMEHLEIGFIICSIPLSLAVIAFFIEIAIPFFRELFS